MQWPSAFIFDLPGPIDSHLTLSRVLIYRCHELGAPLATQPFPCEKFTR